MEKLLNSEERVGAYRVLRKLGAGGMGAVYEAIHDTIERRVAIKVLHSEFAKNPEVVKRFFNEARAVNRIAHPGLVQISEFGHLPDGSAYIVMELLSGETLGQRLARVAGKLPISEVIDLAAQIADALHAAHQKGIVHRDLKPDNVMLVAEPRMGSGVRVKLLDFGIAKLLDDSSDAAPQTKTEAVLGTPQYMSPEQCKGPRGVDAKSDVYSLGVLMYRMLSGRLPFTGQGSGEIVAKQIYEEPPPLAALAAEAPPSLIALIHTLLSKNKEARPTMAQVATELATLSEQSLAPVIELVEPAGARPAADQPPSLSLSGQAQSVASSKSTPWLVVGSSLSAGLILFAMALPLRNVLFRGDRAGLGAVAPPPAAKATEITATTGTPDAPDRVEPVRAPISEPVSPQPAAAAKSVAAPIRHRKVRPSKSPLPMGKREHERPQVEN